jgi:hypothetical protein
VSLTQAGRHGRAFGEEGVGYGAAAKYLRRLQQKYPEVLADKTPDVWEMNLGDLGLWYRAGIGPPGSREAATGVSQLKTAGHAGCRVAAY